MSEDDKTFFCLKCGNILPIQRNPNEATRLYTICDDGKGGYRKCLN